MSATPLLKVENLKTQFFTDAGTVRAVDGISFTVERGELVGLVGESGAGESVAVQSIIRLVDSPARIVDGAITRDVSAAGGVGRVVATVPAHVAVRTVVETFRTQHSESELLARRERNLSTPVRTRAGVDPILAGRLTGAQSGGIRNVLTFPLSL